MAFGNLMEIHNVLVKICRNERFSDSIVVTFCFILTKNGQIGWPLCSGGSEALECNFTKEDLISIKKFVWQSLSYKKVCAGKSSVKGWI